MSATVNFEALDLGEVIAALARAKRDAIVSFDFGGCVPTDVASYRGYYEDLALGWKDPEHNTRPNVESVITTLRAAIGKTFTGWKGGDYVMDERSRLWVDNQGVCHGVAIVEVECNDWIVLLRTWATDR